MFGRHVVKTEENSRLLLLHQQNFLFVLQAEPFIQYLKALSSYQKNVCGALLKFGPQILQSM